MRKSTEVTESERAKLLSKQKTTPSGCIEWCGGTSKYGYGVFIVNRNNKQTYLLVHRVMWSLRNGPIPPKKLICHTCDNRKCCNPDHLFLGTHRLNTIDMCRKGRGAAPKLTESEVYEIRELIENGRMKVKEIAAAYGVSTCAIYGIKNKRFYTYFVGSRSTAPEHIMDGWLEE
jgi:hypothetical protein